MPLFVWLRFHLLITIFQFVFGNSLLLFMHQILFFLLCVIRTLHILQYKNHIHLIMAWNWVRFISVEQKKIEIYTMISFDVWLFNYVNKIGTLALTIWIIWVYILSHFIHRSAPDKFISRCDHHTWLDLLVLLCVFFFLFTHSFV